MQRIKYVAMTLAALASGLMLEGGCGWFDWYTKNGWPRYIALWLNEDLFG